MRLIIRITILFFWLFLTVSRIVNIFIVCVNRPPVKIQEFRRAKGSEILEEISVGKIREIHSNNCSNFTEYTIGPIILKN
jgi:hypothetical protein